MTDAESRAALKALESGRPGFCTIDAAKAMRDILGPAFTVSARLEDNMLVMVVECAS